MYFCVLGRARNFWAGIEERCEDLANSYGLSFLETTEDDLITDIGANVGELHYWLRHSKNSRAVYLAIEPGKKELFCLNLNLKHYNGVSKLDDSALGKSEGLADLFYKPDGAESSLYAPPNFKSPYKVKVKTLYEILSAFEPKFQRIFCKIEGQGSEYDILIGAREKLKSVYSFHIDLGAERWINGLADSPQSEVEEILFRAGFLHTYVTFPQIPRIMFAQQIVRGDSKWVELV